MTGFIETITSEPVRKWYEENTHPTVLQAQISQAIKRGFNWSPETGLLFRHPFAQDRLQQLGYTLVEIIFPRPVDLHHHKDVHEAISVVGGKGEFYDGETSNTHVMRPTLNFFAPKRSVHSFRPDKNSALEIRLSCSGILDFKEEVCQVRFDEFEPWVDYFAQYK